MSAFMVSDETINCVCTIDALVSGPCARRDAFGRELLAMNSAALNERYGDTPQTAADFAFRFFPRKYSLAQQLKALNCLRYQCSEGNVPEWPLYQQIEKAIVAVARVIVGRPSLSDDATVEAARAMPAYNNAEWDLRPAGKVSA